MDKDLLKKKLHEQIDALDNERALPVPNETTVQYSNAEYLHDNLTQGQLKGLQESIHQLENGQWKSHEEVMKLATWLQK